MQEDGLKGVEVSTLQKDRNQITKETQKRTDFSISLYFQEGKLNIKEKRQVLVNGSQLEDTYLR